MKRILSLIAILLLVLAMTASCGATANVSNESYVADSDVTKEDANENHGSTSETTSSENLAATERKIIKTYSIDAETEQFDQTISALKVKINEVGGYIETSSVRERNSTYSDRYATYTIRVPAEKADEFVNALGTLLHVTNSSSSAEDVSDTYYSIEARLNELIVERDSLLQIMSSLDTQKDYNFWLTLNQRLSEIRQNIAVYQAQIQRYDSKVSYSTVDLMINEVVVYSADAQSSFGERIGTSFREGWTDFGNGAQDFAVWFVGALPFLLIPMLAIAAVITVLIVRNKKKKKKSTVSANEEPDPE